MTSTNDIGVLESIVAEAIENTINPFSTGNLVLHVRRDYLTKNYLRENIT